MKTENRYCNICHKECEYQILVNEDNAKLWGSSHAELRDSSHAKLWDSSHAELWDSSHAELWDSSHAELRGSSHAELRDSSHAKLRDSSHAKLWDSSHAELRGSSHAELRGSSHAKLWDSSHAELRGSSHAELRDSSHAKLWDSSHAELWDSSHAELRGSSHAELWDSSHAKSSSPYVTMIIKSSAAKAKGSTIIGNSIITAMEWLEKCGVIVARGHAILFKSVNKDFTTRNGISFKPHTKHEAPDWDDDFKEECGKGIHYSPTVAQARQFRDEGVFVACKVKVSDMADLPAFAQYPDKIRAKGGYTLYEVDEKGDKKVTDGS